MKIRQLSLIEAEYRAHELARDLMQFDEPMPDFSTRYPGVLESCLAQPFTIVGGRYVYFRLTQRAAVLFYLVIKNHPFVNGNKRMAVTLTLVFFYKNNKWLRVDPYKLYEIACDVAKSDSRQKETIIKTLNDFFAQSIHERK